MNPKDNAFPVPDSLAGDGLTKREYVFTAALSGILANVQGLTPRDLDEAVTAAIQITNDSILKLSQSRD